MTVATDVTVSLDGAVAVLCLDGAERMNAIGSHTYRALAAAVTDNLCEVRHDLLARVLGASGRAIQEAQSGSQGGSAALRTLHDGRDSV